MDDEGRRDEDWDARREFYGVPLASDLDDEESRLPEVEEAKGNNDAEASGEIHDVSMELRRDVSATVDRDAGEVAPVALETRAVCFNEFHALLVEGLMLREVATVHICITEVNRLLASNI